MNQETTQAIVEFQQAMRELISEINARIIELDTNVQRANQTLGEIKTLLTK